MSIYLNHFDTEINEKEKDKKMFKCLVKKVFMEI